MTIPISPIAAVKLLREALHWHHHIHNGTAPGKLGAAMEAAYRSSELFELTEAALAVEIEQPASEAAAIVPDWPLCNPGCDYEDPNGGIHDNRSAWCSCDAAKASIARQSAIPLSGPTDAQKLATLRAGLIELGWCSDFGALAQEVLFGKVAAPAVWTQEMLDQIAVDAERLRAKIRPGIDAVTGLPSVFGVPVEACKERHHMHPHACDNRHQCWEPCGELGKSAEHAKRAPSTLAKQVTDAQAEVATWPDSIRAQHGMASAPVDERAALIRDALDIAFDLVNQEAHHIHETYKGYKPHKHAAIDADVATVTAARAALQQPKPLNLGFHLEECRGGYIVVEDGGGRYSASITEIAMWQALQQPGQADKGRDSK